MKRIHGLQTVAVLTVFLWASSSAGQEPAHMDAATHPGAGQFYARLLLSAGEVDAATGRHDTRRALLKVAYGIRSTLALLVDAEMLRHEYPEATSSGFSEAMFRVKYQVYRRDLGPVNTWRTSLLAGVALPGTESEVAPRYGAPLAGLASTAVLGRHGLNAGAAWRGRKREEDEFMFHVSHLYRLAPAAYSATTTGAWYCMLESLNSITDRGDLQHDVAAGVLYEARRWAAEASYRWTVGGTWEEEIRHEITLGGRLLF